MMHFTKVAGRGNAAGRTCRHIRGAARRLDSGCTALRVRRVYEAACVSAPRTRTSIALTRVPWPEST